MTVSHDVDRELFASAARDQAPALVLSSIGPGAIYAAATLVHGTAVPALAGVCLGVIATAVLRYGLFKAYARLPHPPARARFWRSAVAAAACAAGLAWGALVWPLMPLLDLGCRLALASALAAVPILALESLTASFPALAGFAIAALTPVCVAFLASGEPHLQLAGSIQGFVLLSTLVLGYHTARRRRRSVVLQIRRERLLAQRERAWRAAEAESAAKSRALATISHEIRTPITGIMGTAEQLNASPLPTQLSRKVQTILSSCDTLLAIVNDVLDLARIEANHLELCEADFEPVRTAQDVVNLLSAPARAKGVELELVVGPGVPYCAHGDRVRVAQILLNLVGNAIKFTPSGSVRVTLSGPDTEAGLGEALMAEFRLLRFEVCDTGVGIPSSEQHRVFESFTRVPTGTGEQPAGTGLGLAIAKRLAELHGGAIGVRSTPGAGSTFWFTIRVRRPSARAAAAESHDWQPLVHDPLSGRVLVVEDNTVTREIAVSLLRSLGLEVDAASDGDQALERVVGARYDAVLLDCHMPSCDGVTTATRIRELGRAGYERFAELPLIAFTADATEEGRAACLAAGMDDFIVKPFRQIEVLRTLTHWLDATRPRRRLERDTIVNAANMFLARRAS